MTNNRYRVPPNRIPQVVALCPKCGRGTRQLMGAPYAEGYHRRHVCRDVGCDYRFYTLAAYDGSKVDVSPAPFEDRPLTEWEVKQRTQWWEEALLGTYTIEVAGTLVADPFINRLIKAITTEVTERDDIETFIADVYATMKQEVENMDASKEGTPPSETAPDGGVGDTSAGVPVGEQSHGADAGA